MTAGIPHELALGEVYLPPLLIALALGYILSGLTIALLRKISRAAAVARLALAELSLCALYTVALSTFVIPS